MKTILLIFSFGLLIAAPTLSAQDPASEEKSDEATSGSITPTKPPKPHGTFFTGQVGYKFLGYYPARSASDTNRPPLILFFHGATADEDFEKFKHFGPLKYVLEHEESPFAVICPASRQMWSLPVLDVFLQHVTTRYAIDPDRIYVTGVSNGGHATWSIAETYPYRFAAVAPVCGAGHAVLAGQRLKHLPIWVFHGAKDPVVPVSGAQVMIQALEPIGCPIRYTIYPERGHDIARLTYENDELYEWFLKHRRVKPPEPATASVTNKPTARVGVPTGAPGARSGVGGR